MSGESKVLPGLMKQGADFRMEGNLIVSGEITQESESQSFSEMITRMTEAESAINALEGDGYGYIDVSAAKWWASSPSPAVQNEYRRVPLWQFDAGADMDIVTAISMPEDWDDSEGLRWTITFFTTAALTGDVRMQLVVQSIENGTEFISAFDRWSSMMISVPTTAYEIKKEENIAVGSMTNADMPKTFALRLKRNGLNVSDTCAGSIFVIGVTVRYKRKEGIVESVETGSLGDSLAQVAQDVTVLEADLAEVDEKIINPNQILNGCFDIWQRGLTITNPTIGQYCADRWKCFIDGSGVTRSITCQPFSVGQTDVEGNPEYFLRYEVSVAGTSTYNIICNTTENAARLSGETVTLSFWAKCAVAGKIVQPYILQMFGMGGSATQYVLPGYSAVLSTDWQQFSISMDITSVSEKTLGPGSYFGLAFQLPAGTFQIDLANIKLEQGDAVTPMRTRAVDDELRACRWYTYAVSTSAIAEMIASGFASSSTEAYCHLTLPDAMRILPALTVTAADWQLDCIGASPVDVTALTLDDLSMSSKQHIVLKATTAGGLTQYRPYVLVGDGTTGRQLILEAEL